MRISQLGTRFPRVSPFARCEHVWAYASAAGLASIRAIERQYKALLATVFLISACGRFGFDGAGSGRGDDSGVPNGLPDPTQLCAYDPAPEPVVYVGPDGSAAGDGSEALPFSSIRTALDSLSAGGTVLVLPGDYTETVEFSDVRSERVLVRSQVPYAARIHGDLNATGHVFHCFGCGGYTVEGFDISRVGDSLSPLVHVNGNAGNTSEQRFVARNNIVHDGPGGPAVRVSAGAQHVTLERNVIYNGTILLLHIAESAQVLAQDNVLFSGPGMADPPSYLYYLWMEDLGNGSSEHLVARNIFYGYFGGGGGPIGVRGADDSLIENNLVVGLEQGTPRTAIEVAAAADLRIRNNTITGAIDTQVAYGLSLPLFDASPNDGVSFDNNLWSDPSGSMGTFSARDDGSTFDLALRNNLYWNGGEAVTGELGPAADASAVVADPGLPAAPFTLPVWDEQAAQFVGGARSTCELHQQLALAHAIPSQDGAAAGAASPAEASADDILGRPRGIAPSIGAAEPIGP